MQSLPFANLVLKICAALKLLPSHVQAACVDRGCRPCTRRPKYAEECERRELELKMELASRQARVAKEKERVAMGWEQRQRDLKDGGKKKAGGKGGAQAKAGGKGAQAKSGGKSGGKSGRMR